MEDKLRRRGLRVETNLVYQDPATGKSREMDIVARRDYPSGFTAILICECKNNAQPVVVFEKEPIENPQLRTKLSADVKTSGVPGGFWTGTAYISLPDFLWFEQYHHYCQGAYATQYCSFKETKQDGGHRWLAVHDEQHHAALEGLVCVLGQQIDRHYREYEDYCDSLAEAVELGQLDMRAYYPVVVLQGELLAARVVGGRLTLKSTGMGRIRVERLGPGRESSYYQIDVVTEASLPRFLKVIDAEMDEAGRALSYGTNPQWIERTFNKLLEVAPSAQQQGLSLRKFLEPVEDFKNDPIHNWPDELTHESDQNAVVMPQDGGD